MAIIECRECKKQISDKAEKCPSCGIRISRFSNSFKIILFLVFIVFFGYILRDRSSVDSVSKNSIETSASSFVLEEAIKVSAVKMAKDYEQNEARADAIYKKKLIRVSGTVSSIDKDFSDDTQISLKGVDNPYSFSGYVHAKLKKSEESKAIELQKGVKIVLQCRGNGEAVGSPLLAECIIL